MCVPPSTRAPSIARQVQQQILVLDHPQQHLEEGGVSGGKPIKLTGGSLKNSSEQADCQGKKPRQCENEVRRLSLGKEM